MRQLRILITDDDVTTRAILREALNDYGTCELCVNGQEAVEAFKAAWEEQAPFDLIIIDMKMPVMNGADALEHIRHFEAEQCVKQVNETKALVLSIENAPNRIMDAYYRGGATKYLLKPVDINELIDAIQSFGLIDE